MNKEDYVSLEVARLLKEKGFDEYCNTCYYYHDNEWILQDGNNRNRINGKDWMSRPTLYEAAKWLRNKHKVYVSSLPTKECDKTIWYHQITKDVFSDGIYGTVSDEDFTSYEESLNAGILEALIII